MSGTITQIAGVNAFVLADGCSVIGSVEDFMDPLGNAAYQGADWVILPTNCLSPAFFDLKTKLAGEIFQKLMNYNLKCAIVGDVSANIDNSSALRDFVYECNAGSQIAFVSSMAEFEERVKA